MTRACFGGLLKMVTANAIRRARSTPLDVNALFKLYRAALRRFEMAMFRPAGKLTE
jgi:hypothetical protein